MWFDILKKQKSIEELVDSYIYLYGKLYETNDAEEIDYLSGQINDEVFRSGGYNRYEEFMEALRNTNYEQLSLEDFIQAETERYEDALKRGIKLSNSVKDKIYIVRKKIPSEKESEFYDRLYQNPEFLEAQKNYEDYHKRIKEEKENERKRKLEQDRQRENQKRMMALQRARASGKYKRRKGQRKHNKQPPQKKTRSQRKVSAKKDEDKRTQENRDYRESEQRRLRDERRGL